ncbi:MAG: sulfite reductase subunit alpha [Chthoniobacterales bacterium]|nr:sulfite reductase subunit alpha [Chthoniobacterales bacterium]
MQSGNYNRTNPFPAKLIVNKKITLPGSNKETRHFELSLEGSGLTYEVGDSLGVFPTNDPELVDAILKALNFTGDESVPLPTGFEAPIREALLQHFNITELTRQFLQACAQRDSSAQFLNDLLDPNLKTELDVYLYGRDILDSLREFDAARFSPVEFVSYLRKLQPRLYSIASSMKVVGERVHLTVAIVRYEAHGRIRKGVCSTFLAERAERVPVPVFVHVAKHFRLPPNSDTPIIMVGPGTGIAPFRAFLQEREATAARGKNWLFFGEQKSEFDFFYREELEEWLRKGILFRLDTAFSRDQEYKIYVQHRLLENSREVFKWLEEGAYFYVCGDANRMAKDVDQALHQIVQKETSSSMEKASEYVNNLKQQKRYRRDVY